MSPNHDLAKLQETTIKRHKGPRKVPSVMITLICAGSFFGSFARCFDVDILVVWIDSFFKLNSKHENFSMRSCDMGPQKVLSKGNSMEFPWGKFLLCFAAAVSVAEGKFSLLGLLCSIRLLENHGATDACNMMIHVHIVTARLIEFAVL